MAEARDIRRTLSLARLACAGALIAAASCNSGGDAPPLTYTCGVEPAPAAGAGVTAAQPGCGAGDPNLPPEPTFPATVCQTLVATKTVPDEHTLPDETTLDTDLVQGALNACKGTGGAVKLVADGTHNAFVTGHLTIDSVILWVDAGVTLYASRNPDLFQNPNSGNCGQPGINDSQACIDYITVVGTKPGIVGDGVIDGQGGEPLVGHDYSWWQLSGALQQIDGSIGNPTLINVVTQNGTSPTGFLMYRITLHNSPKFHVKITSTAISKDFATCNQHGDGYTVWGITILTPSKWLNSQGLLLSPHFARNSDGVDPGEGSSAVCGVIACSYISTGDDHIAVKGGHYVNNLIVAHNHFGTGHGMSIGSETYGSGPHPPNTATISYDNVGVENLQVYDLTIDADSRPVGNGASPGDFNGIRVKSDPSRGGIVRNVSFKDVCMRDVTNAILISTAYNPLFTGTLYPQFQNMLFQNVHAVTCMTTRQPVVTLNGFNTNYVAGPITLDNVIVDNVGPNAVAAQYSNIVLGPGPVNFMPAGLGVTVANQIATDTPPRACVFPTLPTPQKPPGWLN